MNYAHNVIVTVFVKETENPEEILNRLKQLFPFDIQKEKISVQQETATGINENKIIIYIVKLTKIRHITEFLQNLIKQLGPAQTKTLIEQKESRLDPNLIFYIRLDKKSLINQKYELTDKGDCYHIKIHLAAYPAKRGPALEIIEKIFK